MPPEKNDFDFLECRSTGHHWRVTSTFARKGVRCVMYQCATCTTGRDDIRSVTTGELLWRSYQYVDGYQQPKNAPEKLTRRDYTSTYMATLVDTKDTRAKDLLLRALA